MARPGKRKTKAQIAAELIARRARDFEAVGMQPDAAVLPQHEGVEITRTAQDREGKKVDHNVARRMDAFDALKDGMARDYRYAGCFDAARRLERDILVALGQHDHGRPLDRVDCEQSAYSRVDTMVAASHLLKRLRARLPDRDWWLLSEQIAPTRPWEDWRHSVRYITGEANMHGQAAAVRAALVNLRDAYGVAAMRRAA